MKESKIATITINLPKSIGNRKQIAEWLRATADEIENLDDEQYTAKPRWSFFPKHTSYNSHIIQ